MRTALKLVIVGTALLVPALTPAPTDAAGQVTTAADNCTDAWAILFPHHPSVHGGFPHPDFMEAAKGVVERRQYWNSSGYEAGHSQKFSLCTADLAFVQGGSAVVAHCGHGATCNEVARAVLAAYPDVGNPVVFCTLPSVISNPSGC